MVNVTYVILICLCVVRCNMITTLSLFPGGGWYSERESWSFGRRWIETVESRLAVRGNITANRTVGGSLVGCCWQQKLHSSSPQMTSWYVMTPEMAQLALRPASNSGVLDLCSAVSLSVYVPSSFRSIFLLHYSSFTDSFINFFVCSFLLHSFFLSFVPFYSYFLILWEPGYLSRYSDWLRAGRPGEAVVRVPVGSKIFTSPYRPDRLWGPPNLL
jgi:hypothetical protein